MTYFGATTLAMCVAALGGCSDRVPADQGREAAFPPTPHYRKVLLEQSAAGHPTVLRDGRRDAMWWGLDLRHTPNHRTRRRLDVDGSHIDPKSIGPGRLPPPPGEASNLEVEAFGGCSPAFYVRYSGLRSLMCNRDQPTAGAAEREFIHLATQIARRFDLRDGTAPVTSATGTRVIAVRFAARPGTKRAYSPWLKQLVAIRNGRRILVVVSLKPDDEWPAPRNTPRSDDIDALLGSIGRPAPT